MTEYPKVNHSHIVPRFLLRRFATADKVDAEILSLKLRRRISTRDAAVRTREYRRYRPDGTPIDDIEWMLGEAERAASTALQGLRGAWPPTDEQKSALATLFAYQALRGPRWKEWHNRFVEDQVVDLRSEREHRLESGIVVPVSHQTLDDVETHVRSPNTRLLSMVGFVGKLTTVFGTMRWDLLSFDDDLLLLSDHPLVEWPIEVVERKPLHPPVGHGVLNLLEARMPISPREAILMSWIDSYDSLAPIRMPVEAAANLNAFGIEQAEHQWFAKPGTEPPIEDKRFKPLTPQLFDGYVDDVAKASTLRRLASDDVNSRIGSGLEQKTDIYRRPRPSSRSTD